RVLETHPMPVGVDSPTNCTFGDPDQRTLYITTLGGHLFRVRNTGRRGWIIWPPVRSISPHAVGPWYGSDVRQKIPPFPPWPRGARGDVAVGDVCESV